MLSIRKKALVRSRSVNHFNWSRAALLLGGGLLATIGLGCAGEDVYLVSPDRVATAPEYGQDVVARETLHRVCEEEIVNATNQSLMMRMSALEAMNERTLAYLQRLDDKLEEERWRARSAVLSERQPFEEFFQERAPAAEANPMSECTPAFYMDANGIKRPKPGCL
jgi:hypothetical protein